MFHRKSSGKSWSIPMVWWFPFSGDNSPVPGLLWGQHAGRIDGSLKKKRITGGWMWMAGPFKPLIFVGILQKKTTCCELCHVFWTLVLQSKKEWKRETPSIPWIVSWENYGWWRLMVMNSPFSWWGLRFSDQRSDRSGEKTWNDDRRPLESETSWNHSDMSQGCPKSSDFLQTNQDKMTKQSINIWGLTGSTHIPSPIFPLLGFDASLGNAQRIQGTFWWGIVSLLNNHSKGRSTWQWDKITVFNRYRGYLRLSIRRWWHGFPLLFMFRVVCSGPLTAPLRTAPWPFHPGLRGREQEVLGPSASHPIENWLVNRMNRYFFRYYYCILLHQHHKSPICWRVKYPERRQIPCDVPD